MSEKIKQAGHDNVSTFGIGKDKSTAYWKHLAWQLIHKNYCKQDLDQFNILRLTKDAISVLRKETCVIMSLPKLTLKPEERKAKREPSKHASTNQSPLVEALRKLRRKLADEENKPPFMIFSDMTLHEMIRINPKTLNDLLNVSGIGQHKVSHYGKSILETIELNRTKQHHELA